MAELDPAEEAKRLISAAALAPGSGSLDLHVFARPEEVGAEADLQARVSEHVATYAQAWAGLQYGDGGLRPDYGAQAGLRVTW